MSNKTEIIYEALDEIRDILGAECATVEELPGLVRNVVNDPARSGFTTSFIFSSENNPNFPTADALDTQTGLVSNLDSGWSQTGVNNSSKARSSEQTGPTWMSFAVFSPSGHRISDWSYPINIKGARGPQGIGGEKGEDGVPGKQGEDGADGIIFRSAMAYTMTDGLETPLRPRGGFWNKETNEISQIVSDDGNAWSTDSNGVEKKTYRWISEAIFEQSGNLRGEWSVPFRITGENGEDGVDGQTIEFIYRLLPSIETYEALRAHLERNPLYNNQEGDSVPPVNDNIANTEWTDSPSGISEEMPIEVVCSRTKDTVNNRWRDWSNCITWAKWGEDGTDGDGVEYIYLITAKKDGDTDITPEYVQDRYMPFLDLLTSHPRYQENEFCINGDFTVDGFNLDGYDWTDEPSDVGPTEPMEWVSMRKKTVPPGGKVAVWGEFSTPKIWATYAEDGASYITSYVFARSDSEPDRPEGGSFLDPNPTNQDIWHDSVPSGTKRVWMSVRTFCSSNKGSFDTSWSSPKVMSDSPNFQVEYSNNERINGSMLGSLQQFASESDPEAAWRDAQAKLDPPQIWGDDDEITDPIWMVTSNYTNGEWSPWVLTRIKGEKGDPGDNGTSVSIRFKKDTKQELLDEWDTWVNQGYFFGVSNLGNGDGVFVNEDGFLYVYSGGWYPGEDPTFDIYWQAVEIKGEPGDSSYLYTAYSDDPYEAGAVLYFDVPKKYVGIKASTEIIPEATLRLASTYEWSRWKGEDGWGQEQVFLLTTNYYNPEGNHPPLPARYNDDAVHGYLPPIGSIPESAAGSATWQDSPLDVSEEYPYCWVATRTVTGETFADWRGHDMKAALYSRYAYDGVSSTSINLTNDLAVIPTEENGIDPDFTSEVSTTVQVFVGDEKVEAEHITVSSSSPCVTINGTKVSLVLGQLTPEINKIPLDIKIQGNDRTFTAIWTILYTDTAYELDPTTHSIRRYANGDQAGKLERTSLDVYVYKWDGKKWVDSDTPLFAEITDTEGNISYLEEGSGIKRAGHRATLDLENLINVAKIKAYVVQKNAEGQYLKTGDILSWEVISIAADGLHGGKLEVSLYPDWTTVPMEGNIVDPGSLNDKSWQSTAVTVRKEGMIISPAQSTISIPEKYRDIFEIPLNPDTGFQQGIIEIKDPEKMINVTDLPITVVPSWDQSDSRLVNWRFLHSENVYKMLLSDSVLYKSATDGLLHDRVVTVKILKKGETTYEPTDIKTLYANISYTDGTPTEELTFKTSEPEFYDYVFTIDFGDRANIHSIDFFITDTDNRNGLVIKQETISAQGDGKSAIYVDLYPDTVQIPMENNVVDPDFTGMCTTEVSVYEGEFQISCDNYTIDNIANCTVTKKSAKNCYEVSFDPKTFAPENIVVVANYSGLVRRAVWRMIYTDMPFKIELDSNVVRVGDDGKHKNAVTGKVYQWDGKQYVAKSNQALQIAVYKGAEPAYYSISSGWDVGKEGTFSYDFTTANGEKYSNLYDLTKVEVCVIVDGNAVYKEPMGVIADGTSPFTLNLSPERIQIPTENDGIDPDLIGQSYTIDVTVSKGSNPLPKTDYTISFDPAIAKLGVSYSNGKITIPVTASNYKMLTQEIRVYAGIPAYNQNIESFLILDFKENAYNIVLDADPIRLDENSNPLDPVSGTLYKWDGKKYDVCSSNLKVVNRTTNAELSGTSGADGKFSINVASWNKPKGLMLNVIHNNEVVASEPVGVIRSIFTEAERKAVEQALIDATNANFEEATGILDQRVQVLEQNVQASLSEGGKALADAQAALTRAQEVRDAVTGIGTEGNSILSKEAIYDLSLASLGIKAEVGENNIAADSVFAQYAAICVGKFIELDADKITTGTLSADRISATTITGKLSGQTLQQLSLMSGTTYDNSAWALDSTGKGRLANGNISWDSNGTVTFGSNVKLTWDSSWDSKFNGYATSEDLKGYASSNSLTSLQNQVTTIAKDYISSSTVITNQLQATKGTIGGWTLGDAVIKSSCKWGYNGSQGIELGIGTFKTWVRGSPTETNPEGNDRGTLTMDEGGITITVGTTALRAYMIDVASGDSGSILAHGGIFQTSDETLKNFGGDIPISLDSLREIPKVYYRWKEDDGKTHIGTSAQCVQKLYPEIVGEDNNGKLNVDYSRLSIIALAAVDKLYEENINLKARLTILEEKYVNS